MQIACGKASRHRLVVLLSFKPPCSTCEQRFVGASHPAGAGVFRKPAITGFLAGHASAAPGSSFAYLKHHNHYKKWNRCSACTASSAAKTCSQADLDPLGLTGACVAFVKVCGLNGDHLSTGDKGQQSPDLPPACGSVDAECERGPHQGDLQHLWRREECGAGHRPCSEPAKGLCICGV